MILFGHIGITTLIGSFLSLSLLVVLIGSLTPDIIDKTLLLLGLTNTGRFIGHSLFLGSLISLIIYIVLRKKVISFSLFFGFMFHLLEDATKFVPWFYPFVNYNFSAYNIGPVFTPFNIASETIGIIMLIYLVKTNSHFRNDIADTFKLINNKKKIPK
jgi:membrane-bound metal-dependent hydrolase YbcI (DUF457 family)